MQFSSEEEALSSACDHGLVHIPPSTQTERKRRGFWRKGSKDAYRCLKALWKEGASKARLSFNF